MRGPILALLVVVIGSLTTLTLSRGMSDYAPEWIWRMAYVLVLAGGVAIGLLSDPTWEYLKNFREHEIVSTFAVAASFGILAGAVWMFWFVGFPTSPAYMDLRVIRWAKRLNSPPWIVNPARHPGCSFGLYIDNIDNFGVGVSRQIDPPGYEHQMAFKAVLGLTDVRLSRFEQLSTAEREKFFRELGIAASSLKIGVRITEFPNEIVTVEKLVFLKSTLSNEELLNALIEIHGALILCGYTIDKLLSEASSH